MNAKLGEKSGITLRLPLLFLFAIESDGISIIFLSRFLETCLYDLRERKLVTRVYIYIFRCPILADQFSCDPAHLTLFIQRASLFLLLSFRWRSSKLGVKGREIEEGKKKPEGRKEKIEKHHLA